MIKNSPRKITPNKTVKYYPRTNSQKKIVVKDYEEERKINP